jgi:peptide-methionine (R)-S-oxide reductase
MQQRFNRRNTVNRRRLLALAPSILFASMLPACARESAGGATAADGRKWKELLEPERYRILFEEGTEAAGSSPLNQEKRDGAYVCAACHQPLFDSATKYESGTGWPSFYRPLPNAVATRTEYKLILPRTEYHCTRCEGHQGHVFEDGPPPTGLRYCNNGLALRFVPRDQPLPALR